MRKYDGATTLSWVVHEPVERVGLRGESISRLNAEARVVRDGKEGSWESVCLYRARNAE